MPDILGRIQRRELEAQSQRVGRGRNIDSKRVCPLTLCHRVSRVVHHQVSPCTDLSAPDVQRAVAAGAVSDFSREEVGIRGVLQSSVGLARGDSSR